MAELLAKRDGHMLAQRRVHPAAWVGSALLRWLPGKLRGGADEPKLQLPEVVEVLSRQHQTDGQADPRLVPTRARLARTPKNPETTLWIGVVSRRGRSAIGDRFTQGHVPGMEPPDLGLDNVDTGLPQR